MEQHSTFPQGFSRIDIPIMRSEHLGDLTNPLICDFRARDIRTIWLDCESHANSYSVISLAMVKAVITTVETLDILTIEHSWVVIRGHNSCLKQISTLFWILRLSFLGVVGFLFDFSNHSHQFYLCRTEFSCIFEVILPVVLKQSITQNFSCWRTDDRSTTGMGSGCI